MNRRRFLKACAVGVPAAGALRLAIQRPAKCDHRPFDIVKGACTKCGALRAAVLLEIGPLASVKERPDTMVFGSEMPCIAVEYSRPFHPADFFIGHLHRE